MEGSPTVLSEGLLESSSPTVTNVDTAGVEPLRQQDVSTSTDKRSGVDRGQIVTPSSNCLPGGGVRAALAEGFERAKRVGSHETPEPEGPGVPRMRRGLQISIPTLLVTLASLISPALASAAECPNETLRAKNNSLNLPDCRAYEQVSPPEKEGGSGGVLNFDYPLQADGKGVGGLPMRSSVDGSAIVYTGEPFFHVPAKDLSDESLSIEYLSTRTTSNWETESNVTVSPEEAPIPALPSPPETNGYEVTEGQVLEETPDGSKVFFLDERVLMPGISNPAPGEPDLYEYTAPSPSVPLGRLEDLTTTKAGHADARGILGVGGEGAEEGSYVYFVAGGMLAQGAASGGCGLNTEGLATGTGCNLYLDHDGTTTYLTTLPAGDEVGVGNQLLGGIAGVRVLVDWPSLPFERTAEVSPNGRYLAFGSFPLGPGPNQNVFEVYRFDATATERQELPLICVSCGSSESVSEALIPSSPDALINGADRQRSVLSDGRVFFTTAARLVPQDVNHQADVYEWENGAPHLISGGASEAPAVFTDASANGSDAFFTTSQSLVPSDQDEITDVYDAREGGGFPAPPLPTCPTGQQCPGSPTSGAPPTASPSLTNTRSEPPGASTTAGANGPTKPKPLTRAQKLAKALRTCRKTFAGRAKAKRRGSCERVARAKYAPKKKASSEKGGHR